MSTQGWKLDAHRRSINIGPPLATLALLPVQAAVRLTPQIFLATLLIFLFRPPDVDLYELDRIAFLVLAVACLLRTVVLGKSLWPAIPLIRVMLPLALLAVIPLLGQPYNPQTWSLLAAKFAVPYALYYLASLTFDTPTAFRHLETFFLWVLGYLSFTAILQFLGWDALVFPRFILNPELGIHIERARGPFLQAVANGVTLNLLGLVAFSAVYRGRLRGWIAILLLAALPIAILATMTRAVWLGFAGSIMWLGLSSRGIWRKISAATGVVAALGLLVTLMTPKSESALLDRAEDQSPVEFRMAVYQTALEMAGEHPLLGWGVNQMPQEIAQRVEGYRSEAYAAHNSYLEIFVENGIVGFALYLWIALGLFRLGRKPTADDAWQNTLAGEAFRRLWPVLVCVYLFNACFVVMNYQFVNALVFTLAGVLAVHRPIPAGRRRAFASR